VRHYQCGKVLYHLLTQKVENGYCKAMETKRITPENPSLHESEYINVKFQQGLPPEVGVNGARLEDVVEVLLSKLELYQQGSVPCRENEEAIQSLRNVKDAMARRRQRRMLQGVFNTMTPHAERTEDVLEEFSATGA
jgi:hypothetical protein